MAAIWLLCRSRLKNSKTQNLFVALLILLSTLLVTTAAIVMANTGRSFTDMHDKTNGSHQLLLLEKGLHDPQFVHQWWEAQQGVETSRLLRFRTLSGITFNGHDAPNLYLYMMDTPEPPLRVDSLVFAQGVQRDSPERGTVWIPTSMANSYGISVGDNISFHTGSGQVRQQVAAVVIDVPFGAPFTNTARIWMNSEDYRDSMTPLPGADSSMIGLRFDDYSSQAGYWDRFGQALGGPFLETRMEFEAISSFYLIINQIIGFIMIFLGLVMMLIALITIGFTLSDAILAHYRTIGVIKSLGLTSRSTVLAYVCQYGLLACLGILPGLALSILLSRAILNLSVSSLKTGNEELAVHGIGTAMLVGLSVFAMIVLFAARQAGKTRSIQPAQAIRHGMSETESRRAAAMNAAAASRLEFGRLPVFAVIGLRNLIKNRKGSALMLALTMAASSVLVLGYVLLNSIIHVQQTTAKWGYDSANVAAIVVNKATFSRSDFERALSADPRIKNAGWQGNRTAVVNPEPAARGGAAGRQPLSLYLNVLDGSYEQMGFGTLNGRNPRESNEIALGVNVAKTLDKEPGDLVDIYIEGRKQSLLITGVYQSIANSSYSARVTIEAVRAASPSFNDMDVSLINVKDISTAEAVADGLDAAFKGSASVVTQKTLLDSVFKEAADILVYPISLLGALFVLAAFIIIYSSCRIHIRREGKTFGIYKSIGMTSTRIRMSVALGITALALLGSLLGILIGVYALPLLLENVLAGYGIVKLPVVLHWGGIPAFASIPVAAAFAGSWASSRAIRTTSPRILTAE
ncbi:MULTISPECIES: FtsX-like permease family protein [unclassified Paenibacillus]|uniref:ABC transporter permease n=1 Tax=unclassified Paenibacillus TaxID=185978 RepID=UPI000953C37A|nr:MULTISPECIES: FtsX-like permease family protein [unclassified Paenibacillus]ASS64805.1 FtsX-like permease family protein [Paenibacillus sp. RUD330]SIR05432.1 putative ABC transport system permease protein [Paenibacillus sp. RU4X]SIR29929.1 putative ABC transport system permease protein [Paenibacillus sp. RU4T]